MSNNKQQIVFVERRRPEQVVLKRSRVICVLRAYNSASVPQVHGPAPRCSIRASPPLFHLCVRPAYRRQTPPISPTCCGPPISDRCSLSCTALSPFSRAPIRLFWQSFGRIGIVVRSAHRRGLYQPWTTPISQDNTITGVRYGYATISVINFKCLAHKSEMRQTTTIATALLKT